MLVKVGQSAVLSSDLIIMAMLFNKLVKRRRQCPTRFGERNRESVGGSPPAASSDRGMGRSPIS